MKRLNDDEIILSQAEADMISEFIWNSLYSAWDRYTDHYICSDKWEDGMKRMDPEAYDFREQLTSI
jgi:hypothetical protein